MQGKACLSRAACSEHPYRVYWYCIMQVNEWMNEWIPGGDAPSQGRALVLVIIILIIIGVIQIDTHEDWSCLLTQSSSK